MFRSIRFSVDHSHGEEELDLQDRRIMFEISDGRQWSAPAFATITIVPINDNTPDIILVPRGEVCNHLDRISVTTYFHAYRHLRKDLPAVLSCWRTWF